MLYCWTGAANHDIVDCTIRFFGQCSNSCHQGCHPSLTNWRSQQLIIFVYNLYNLSRHSTGRSSWFHSRKCFKDVISDRLMADWTYEYLIRVWWRIYFLFYVYVSLKTKQFERHIYFLHPFIKMSSLNYNKEIYYRLTH